MELEKISSNRKKYYDALLEDYKEMLCRVIQNYQKKTFGIDTPVVIKKELLRKYCFSADLARKVMQGDVMEPVSMMHVLDVFENTLTLYENTLETEGREALIKRKNYFYKKYVVSVDLSTPIRQRFSKTSNRKNVSFISSEWTAKF